MDVCTRDGLEAHRAEEAYQNGVAERAHRDLKEAVTAMLIAAKMPVWMWPLAPTLATVSKPCHYRTAKHHTRDGLGESRTSRNSECGDVPHTLSFQPTSVMSSTRTTSRRSLLGTAAQSQDAGCSMSLGNTPSSNSRRPSLTRTRCLALEVVPSVSI